MYIFCKRDSADNVFPGEVFVIHHTKQHRRVTNYKNSSQKTVPKQKTKLPEN